jgi:hypothetical protein
MTIIEGSAAVAVGIDAAVVANHHIVVRRPEAGRPGTMVDDFVVPPTLAGMERLTKRLVESAWDPRRLHTLEVRMEHGTAPFAEAVPA